MNTKRPIVEFIAEHLPQYRFVPELRPNLVFQHLQPSDMYRCIAIQRDSASCGLAIEIAATYSPVWRGEPAVPLGVDTALVNLRLGTRMVDAMKYWTFYEPTPEGLRHTLSEIHREFMQLAPPFFEQAERQLLCKRHLRPMSRRGGKWTGGRGLSGGLPARGNQAGYVVVGGGRQAAH